MLHRYKPKKYIYYSDLDIKEQCFDAYDVSLFVKHLDILEQQFYLDVVKYLSLDYLALEELNEIDILKLMPKDFFERIYQKYYLIFGEILLKDNKTIKQAVNTKFLNITKSVCKQIELQMENDIKLLY